MEINDLLDIIHDILIKDSDIKHWCQEKYSSYQTVYEGVDSRNPPSSDDYPVIHFFPLTKTSGYEMSEKPHAIGVMCGVFDETLTTSTYGGVKSKRYRGVQYAEKLRSLIEKAVTDELEAHFDTEQYFVDTVDTTYEMIESFPFFLAMSAYLVSEKVTQGDEVFI